MNNPKPFFLAIEGPIGVGKTTLARWLSQVWQSELTLERFANNPFLPLFYTDRQVYALQTQLYFLLDRFDQWSELPAPAFAQTQLPTDSGVARAESGAGATKNNASMKALVSDYLFDKDRVFAELTLSSEELRRYLKVFEALRANLVTPTHIIFLTSDVPTLLTHINKRARPYEAAIDAAYLSSLSQAYDAFFAGYQDAPVLTLDTHELDDLELSETELVTNTQTGQDASLSKTAALLKRLELFIEISAG